MLLGSLLAACQAPGKEAAAGTEAMVTVTTAMPQQQTFHDTVEAWGSVLGNPQQARALNLAHAGQVVALKVVPGQTVARGQALLVVAPDPLARNALQQAQNALTLARGDLGRTEQLAAQRLATQSQLAAARKAVTDAEAALAAQRALGGGADETVAAPADGVVTSVAVGLGERIAANAPLVGFTPAHALLAQLGVQPEQGAQLAIGMPVRLRRVYEPANAIEARLSLVGQAIDAQTHLLPVQAELPAAASAWPTGTALAATIEMHAYSAWAVPREAVLHDDQGGYLFQVHEGHARRVGVTLRHPDGDPVGVLGALDAQTAVIVSGAYELADGQAVKERAQ